MAESSIGFKHLRPQEESAGFRVLVVSPGPGEAALLRRLLHRQEGSTLTFYTATSCDQALEQLDGQRFDACFYDADLGEASVFRFLRSLQAARNRLPVILLATPDLEDLVVLSYRLGISDYLIKGSLTAEMLLRSLHYAREASRLEGRLAAANERAQATFERILAPAFRLSADGELLDCNAAFLHLFGHLSKEAAGRSGVLAMLLPEAWSEGYVEFHRELASLDGKRVWLRRADGALLRARMRVNKIEGETQGEEILEGSLIDLTEVDSLRRKLEQSRRLEVLGRMAGGAVHDLNNMITTVLGYSDLLLSELPAASMPYQFAEEIRADGIRAKAMLETLLDTGRETTAESGPVDLNDTIRGLRGTLDRHVGTNVELVMSLGSPLPEVTMARSDLERVVLNLVLNARDAMPDGGRVEIDTRLVGVDGTESGPEASLRPGSYVLLTVTDDGHGMDAATKAQMFKPFFTTKGLGNGLGLTSVYDHVRANQGCFGVDSAVGEGTEIRIWLPAAS